MGEMMPAVERQLDEHFAVHRSAARSIPEIVAEYGSRIRAIVTRGREPTDAALIAASAG